ncbi:sensor domain-containing diguanylate cyclase [Aestuariirhabdus litorea]|uniref:Diguanylate cyclase n=1 Tax=Aestuariirhabdus litorea TaxID=2528527 RepID=A0A3P3VRC1_9GAMM|nr:diguanylate cyclase [Aestuariirhabdus litorea]RRJ85285.1 diguanylate cyclase [Aestuariirhabdus litorea]RWW98506.1 diguanylate cyclase [Endozoicomonadaceae bacterium GTF-13]
MNSFEHLLTLEERRHLQRQQLRDFIYWSAVLVVVVLVVVDFALNQVKKIETDRLVRSAQLELQAYTAFEAERLGNLAKEVVALSRDSTLLSYVTERDIQSRQTLETHWVGVAWFEARYSQISLLDPYGLEMVRVEYDAINNRAFAGSQLDYLGESYFVEDAASLEVGEVYFSRIDLAQGETIPQIVLRAITPVVDLSGQRDGLLVLSLRAEQMLGGFYQGLGSGFYSNAMVDDQGDYVIGSQAIPSESGLSDSLGMDHPLLWRSMQVLDSGSVKIPGGMVVFRNSSLGFSEHTRKRYLLSYISDATVEEATAYQRRVVLGGAAVFTLLAMGWFWYISGGLLQRTLRKRMLDVVSGVFESNEAICITDAEGRVEAVNGAFGRTTGYLPDEVIGRKISILNSGRHDEAFFASMWSSLKTQGFWKGEVMNRHKSGEVFPELLLISAVRGEKGEIVKYVSHYVDITEQKKQERELKLAAAAFETNVGVVVTDPSGSIQRVNGAFTRITGYSAEEVVGENPRMLQSGYHDATFYQQLWQAILDQGYWRGEVWNKRKNGDIYPEWITITAVRDEDGETLYFVSTFEDITRRKELEKELERLATTDSLTGLWNRRRFEQELRKELHYSQRYGGGFTFVIFDIDHFKQVNDSFGHDVGDEVIQRVADCASNMLRAVDSIGRWGGEEFVLLLPKSSEADALVICERLRLAIEHDETHPRITCSFGVSQFLEGTTEDDMIKRADQALYRAKESGRNCVCLAEAEEAVKNSN